MAALKIIVLSIFVFAICAALAFVIVPVLFGKREPTSNRDDDVS